MPSPPLKILVTGCNGRMGKAVIACCEADPTVTVGAAIDVDDPLAEALPRCDAVVDFSFHTFSPQLAAACAEAGKTMVMGTTGHTDDELDAVRRASAAVPVVLAPNFSVGVNTLFWLTAKACDTLGPDFDLEVLEMHHRMKQDAPSGTAKRLAEILCTTRNLDYHKNARHGRHGDIGARPKAEVGVHALRGGDVVGDHTVVFATDGERVELTHKASSRHTFANGALRAARWAHGRTPGLYDMQDVLGLPL